MRGSSQPVDVPLLHQLEQLALAHHRVGQVQARELDLPRAAPARAVLDQPVVERPMILELERAERVRDALDRVRRRMGEVVHRIDAPVVAGPVVVRAPDAVEHRVAHVDVRRRHVDSRAQHVRAVLELAGAHARKQIQVLVDRPVAKRARSVPARSACRDAARISSAVRLSTYALPLRIRCDGVLVERLEVVGRVLRSHRPSRSPASGRRPRSTRRTRRLPSSGWCRRTGGCSVPPNSAGDAEIQADRFRVSDVQVAVRLGRKSRGHASLVPAFLHIIGHDGANEIGRGRRVAIDARRSLRLGFSYPCRKFHYTGSARFSRVLQGSTGFTEFCGFLTNRVEPVEPCRTARRTIQLRDSPDPRRMPNHHVARLMRMAAA